MTLTPAILSLLPELLSGTLSTPLLAAVADPPIESGFAFTGSDHGPAWWQLVGLALLVGALFLPVTLTLTWLAHRWHGNRRLALNALLFSLLALFIFLSIRFFNLARNSGFSFDRASLRLIVDRPDFYLVMASIILVSFIGSMLLGWLLKRRVRKREALDQEAFQ